MVEMVSAARLAIRSLFAFVPRGFGVLFVVGLLAALLIAMALTALLHYQSTDASFLWAMPVFAALFAGAFHQMLRPVVISRHNATGCLCVVKPRPWPLPNATVRIPLQDISFAHVEWKRARGSQDFDKARIVLVMRGQEAAIPLCRWADRDSFFGRDLERTCAAIDELVKERG